MFAIVERYLNEYEKYMFEGHGIALVETIIDVSESKEKLEKKYVKKGWTKDKYEKDYDRYFKINKYGDEVERIIIPMKKKFAEEVY